MSHEHPPSPLTALTRRGRECCGVVGRRVWCVSVSVKEWMGRIAHGDISVLLRQRGAAGACVLTLGSRYTLHNSGMALLAETTRELNAASSASRFGVDVLVLCGLYAMFVYL